MFNFFKKLKPDSNEPAESARQSKASAGSVATGGSVADIGSDFLRTGDSSSSGGVNGEQALSNMTVLRCVCLIAESIGMLPINLIKEDGNKEFASDHPVHRLLRRRPNDWQTPYEFKVQMQARALIDGNAYARIVWSTGRPIALIPIAENEITSKLEGFNMVYEYRPKTGGMFKLKTRDVLHIRDITFDGVQGKSRVKLAKEVLMLANDARIAAQRIFKQGMMAGGALTTDKTLSKEAYENLTNSLRDRFSGSENAGKWMVLEAGLKPEQFQNTATDSQTLETRTHQIEEIARAFGVPRPLLMMDDTSWGSGIETLGILFVQYGLQHWFTAWEQAITRSMLSEAEIETLTPKFNEKALLRGTMKDQSEFFAKALGSGGHPAWMTQNEVRDLLDMPVVDQDTANKLITQSLSKGAKNEPDKTT